MKKRYYTLLFFVSICVFSLPSQAQENSLELIKLAKENPNFHQKDSLLILLIDNSDEPLLLHEAYYLNGKNHAKEGLFEEAQKYFIKAIEYADGDSRTISRYKLRLADCYLDMGDLTKAIEIALNVLTIAEKIADSSLMTHSLSNIAEYYRHYDLLDNALDYNLKALSIVNILDDEDIKGKAYNNLSAVLGEMGEDQRAIDSLKSGLNHLSETNFFGRGKLNSNIGYCYRNMGQYQEAINYHRIALYYKEKANMESSIGYTMGAIGRAFLGLEKIDSAFFYVKKELDLALQYKNPHNIKDAYIHLADVYLANEDYKNAYYHFQNGKEIEDSLYDGFVEQQALLYQRKYDLSKKEQEIIELRNQQLLTRAKQQNQLIILAAFILIFGLLTILFRSSAKRRTQEKKLVELKLQASEEERTRNEKELRNFTKDLMLKNKSIKLLNDEILEKEHEIDALKNLKSVEIEELAQLKILTDDDWTRFKLLFERVHPNLFNRMNASDYSFTKGEKRLMSLIRLDMENYEIADTLGISPESVSKSRFRLKKKLELKEGKSLEEFVLAL